MFSMLDNLARRGRRALGRLHSGAVVREGHRLTRRHPPADQAQKQRGDRTQRAIARHHRGIGIDRHARGSREVQSPAN